ncbi:MAG: phosphoenolpyruvate--protein phosphotransferase [Candidatus Muiribacteriota bacterium]
MKVFKGDGVAHGIATGKIILFLSDSFINVEPRVIAESKIEKEIKRFEASITKSKKQLHTIKNKVKKTLGVSEAGIFHSQLLILEDKYLYDKITGYIVNKRLNAEYSVVKAIKEFEKELSRTDNTYLKERVIDLEDVKQRFLRNFGTSIYHTEFSNIAHNSIAVARSVTASDSIELINLGVKGLILESGGVTSHSAILARAMGIPTVVGVPDIIEKLIEEKQVNDRWNEGILDAYNGLVYISPDEKTSEKYKKKIKLKEKKKKERCKESSKPALTRDGKSVTVYANLGVRFNIDSVLCEGGAGVGLYRTEFQYMLRHDFPDEKTLYLDYSNIFKKLKKHYINIRLLDVGGDKFLPYFDHGTEKNPELGRRSLRFLFEHEEILRTQIRAILRAAEYGNPRILIPMVSSVEEIKKIKKIISEEKQNLEKEKVKYKKEYVPVGIMLEVPSVIFILDKISEYADFFSIGSNDLIQFTLAVDRENFSMRKFFNPSHPAVFRIIKYCADIINKSGKELAICGEMASEYKYVPALIGLGISNLSMNLSNIKDTKDYIRVLKYKECEELANKILNLEEIEKIDRLLEEFYAENMVNGGEEDD